jgi:uncharacterized protein (DUF2249 family)
MDDKVVSLDVREEIQQGREPFARIMQTVTQLQGGEKLLLIAPFEPVPLFKVMTRQGFSHQSKSTDAGDWEVLFFRNSETTSVSDTTPVHTQVLQPPTRGHGCSVSVIEVDARHLEPPQPLVVILEALANLPAGAELLARTDRRPMHLYAQLVERGFTGQTEEQTDGSFVTHIQRG